MSNWQPLICFLSETPLVKRIRLAIPAGAAGVARRACWALEPDSSSWTVPARGQGRPATGDQDGEGREAGQVPLQPSSVALSRAGTESPPPCWRIRPG